MSQPESLPSKSVRLLSETLGQLKIEFALVGGVAVALVSIPRFTADVDAVLLDIYDRLEWLIEQMSAAGYVTRAQDQVRMTRRTRVLTLTDPYGVGVDLMLGILPFDEQLVRGAFNAVLSDETTVPVASAESLVVMKAVAWRDKDIGDIQQILATNPNLDRTWCTETFAEYAELLEVPERVAELAKLLDKKN